MARKAKQPTIEPLDPELEPPSEPDSPPARDTAISQRDAQALVDQFLRDVRGGTPWFDALLHAIATWDVHAETVDERDYRYLYGGEAFDWLVLAERLCNAGLDAGSLPQLEVEALLLEEQLPQRMDEETFKERLGPAKYRAHLNFLYGIRLEEALQLTVEERIHKERGGSILTHDRRGDSMNDVFRRIYGDDRDTLLHEFRSSEERPQLDRISLTELKEFTYWLFKRRVAVQDPARVASDTRLAMLTLQRLEEARNARRGPAGPAGGTGSTAGAIEIVETVAVPTL
jgi:hypothetical protein